MTAALELSPALLWSMGFRSFTEDQVRAVLVEVYDALEARVGTTLAAQLNARKLAEFERLIDSGSPEERTMAWLSANLPTYREVVQEEYARLIARLQEAQSVAKRLDSYKGGEE